MAIVIVQAKVTQNSYFLVSKPILKKFSRLFLSPNPSYAKNRVKMVPKEVFFSMSIPEATSCRVNPSYLQNYLFLETLEFN